LFSAGSKARFRNKIRQFLCDEAEIREEVRKRLTKEAQEADANRHLSENRRSTNYNSYANNEELATFFSTTPSDLQELRETFSLVVDNNGDGTIDSNELTRLLDILGMRKDNEEIQDFIDTLTSGLKRISFADFIKTL
jgi:Ca2+-binding EF-hand superfamily protein